MLRSAHNLIETANNPTINRGGQSSSDIIQSMNDNLRSDLLTLTSRIAKLETAIAISNNIFTAQSTALASKITSLNTSLTTLASGLGTTYNTTIVDMYTLEGISPPTDTSATSADVNLTYGQATLNITNTQDKLVTEDSNGDIWIPDSSSIGYVSTPAATIVPQEYEYLYDDNYIYCLDQRLDTAWTREVSETCDVWIKAKIPAEVFTNALANTIILHPFPTLTHTLVSVEYKNLLGSWISCDLAYLPGYNGATVPLIGNTRLLFPATDISEIRIRLRIVDASSLYWGFTKLELKMLDFSATSSLNVNFAPTVADSTYNSPTYTLFGKSPAALAYISKTVNGGSGKKVELALTQQSAGSTPLLTYVQSEWSS